MSKLTGWVIQETLRGVPKINIPWLQHTFSINYTQAKAILVELALRGWVVPAADGRYWRVRSNRLFLRHLELEETDSLHEKLTNDCVSALECLREEDGMWATRKQLERAVRGPSDTVQAIRALTGMKLIRHVGERYYCRISRLENHALCHAATTAMRLSTVDGVRNVEVERTNFRALLWGAIEGTVPLDDDEDEDDE